MENRRMIDCEVFKGIRKEKLREEYRSQGREF
jgi:hypothetical protein